MRLILLITLGLVREAVLKKTKVKLDFLTDINLLLMAEKDVRGGICHTIHRYMKANNEYMKNYDTNKDSSYLKYWDKNNLYGWVMSQKLPVNDFKWVKKTSQFNKNFKKIYNKNNDVGYFIEPDVLYLEKLVRNS